MNMHSEFIHIPVDRRASYIYRFLSIKRLFELFETRRNVVVSPKKWDDPFENFIIRGQRLPRQHWYGQCWTRRRASDAMWRIYSPDSRGVRIRSTPSSLVTACCRTDCICFIGWVQYLPEQQLRQFARKAVVSDGLPDPRAVAESLLIKRKAFSHEGEVRLLVLPRSKLDREDDLLKIEVDAHSLIDQIMMDPRMSKAESKALRTEIRARTKFKGPIRRSLLYTPPSWLFDE